MVHLSCNAGPAFLLAFVLKGNVSVGDEARRPLFQQERAVTHLTCEL